MTESVKSAAAAGFELLTAGLEMITANLRLRQAKAESDPIDDALVGVAKVGGGLVAGVGKMIGGVARAVAPDDDD